MPVVSVGLAVRNGAAHMKYAISSVLQQDLEDIELVISDNASTDDTESICREFAAADRRVRYYRNPMNIGLLGNNRRVIDLARGSFFRIISHDDTMEPRLLSECLNVFNQNPGLVLVTTEVQYLQADGSTYSPRPAGDEIVSDDPVCRLSNLLALFDSGHLLIDPLAGVMKLDVLKRAFRGNHMRDDLVLSSQLALAGPWGHVPTVLARNVAVYLSSEELVRKLELPRWHVRGEKVVALYMMLRGAWHADLTWRDRRRATRAVLKFYAPRIFPRLTNRYPRILRILEP